MRIIYKTNILTVWSTDSLYYIPSLKSYDMWQISFTAEDITL